MEVIATAGETAELLAAHPRAQYLVFPEDRRFPVRMAEDLPLRWIERGPRESFAGEAMRGEFFAFQIGICAARSAIADLDVTFSDLTQVKPASPPGLRPAAIPSSGAHSFNTRGVNWDGREFKKACAVARGKIQPLWCGFAIPRDIPPGEYGGEVVVQPIGLSPTRV